MTVNLFRDAGITEPLKHAFTRHKIRTRQSIEMIVADANLPGDVDRNERVGVREFPVYSENGTEFAMELDPDGTTASEEPVIDTVMSLPAGGMAPVAGTQRNLVGHHGGPWT